MPLYSAYDLIDKNILLNKDVNVYSVADIDANGDTAKPIGVMKAGSTFVVDSFLAQTLGYTDEYGLTYAPRQQPYLTFFDGQAYDAIAVIGDGRFSLQALKDEGVLTIAEQTAAKNAAELPWYEKLFSSLGGGVQSILLTGVIIYVAGVFVLPKLIQTFEKKPAAAK